VLAFQWRDVVQPPGTPKLPVLWLELSDGRYSIPGKAIVELKEVLRPLKVNDILEVSSYHAIQVEKHGSMVLLRKAVIIGNEPQIGTPSPALDECESASATRTLEDGTCAGGEFSRYGVKFDTCITRTFPPPTDAEFFKIARTCYFFDYPADIASTTQVLPQHCRNVLYWWYDVNFYSIRGAQNRMVMPQCIVDALRSVYPNPEGHAYVGHRDNL
jgi:hypothetical protein